MYTITLTKQQIQTVFAVLGEMRLKDSLETFLAIRDQVKEQDEKAESYDNS